MFSAKIREIVSQNTHYRTTENVMLVIYIVYPPLSQLTALAQSVERTAFNRVVAGSIPACGAHDALAHTSVATFCGWAQKCPVGV